MAEFRNQWAETNSWGPGSKDYDRWFTDQISSSEEIAIAESSDLPIPEERILCEGSNKSDMKEVLKTLASKLGKNGTHTKRLADLASLSPNFVVSRSLDALAGNFWARIARVACVTEIFDSSGKPMVTNMAITKWEEGKPVIEVNADKLFSKDFKGNLRRPDRLKALEIIMFHEIVHTLQPTLPDELGTYVLEQWVYEQHQFTELDKAGENYFTMVKQDSELGQAKDTTHPDFLQDYMFAWDPSSNDIYLLDDTPIVVGSSIMQLRVKT